MRTVAGGSICHGPLWSSSRRDRHSGTKEPLRTPALGEAEPVARIVPHDRLDPIGTLGRWLEELDPPFDEGLIVGTAVGRGHDAGAERPLGHKPANLRRAVSVEHR